MSRFSLSTKVLEAGGHIEERAGYPDFRKFEERYVFTEESLKRLLQHTCDDCAYIADIALLGHERSIRERVIRAIRTRAGNESV
jgi:hypothetical protein